MQETLVLRDIHPSVAPAWWPPAPGWWLLGLVVAGLALAFAAWRWRRVVRRRRLLAQFDAEVAAAAGPAAELAAISSLLRRAARRVDPAADRLEGQAWLDLLDAGVGSPRFQGARGRLLLEGPFRRDPPHPAELAALREAARTRVLEWMEGRR